jgi:hypothetical protein
MPPLLNAAMTLQCAHGGIFPVAPRGQTPMVGGTPGLTLQDFPGLIAAGCTFNISGAPAPCAIVSVAAGPCTRVVFGGVPAVHSGLVCMTSNGVPTMPVSNPGQIVVQGT